MTADPLTRIVKSLDLTGAVFLEGELTAPWAIEAQVTAEDCRPFMPAPRQIIAYHVMTEGEAVVEIAGHECCRVAAGDVLFLPSNLRIVMASAPGLAPIAADDLLMPAGEDGLVRISSGGGGALTRMFCGFIASNAGPNPLLNTLPEALVISVSSLATRRWIEASIAMAARELGAGRLGSGAVTAQLSELLLIEAMRLHLERDAQPSGWLAGMADPRIARTLARIHADLACPPSVVELAELAGMSRTAFVDRFVGIMGQGPGAYALAYRIDKARLLLHETDLGLAEISWRVGYEAPESFSRAFKRATGQSPAEWRIRRGTDSH
ncbi:MAG: AraC family transcriptional regulator [Pseudomonadota bacterium]